MKLVYLSPVPWNSMSQRPHFFIQHAFHAGVKEIIWVEPYPGRLPNLGDLIPGRHAREPASKRTFINFTVVPVPAVFPIEPFHFLFKLFNKGSLEFVKKQVNEFKDENTILVIGKPSLLALELSKQSGWKSIFFDAMDNYPAFFKGYSSFSMANIEKKIASTVNTVICTSHPLQEKFSRFTNVELCLNACTSDFVTGLRRERIESGKGVVFGYVGTIASWFDWSWVIELAELNPSSKIRLIGPLKTLKPINLPKNILIEKAISHDEVPIVLSHIDVGLIPFQINDITRFVDPIKFYEYSAKKIPLLSTRFGEMFWHNKKIESHRTDCPFKVPNDTLYFCEDSLESVTWEDRFSELFPKIFV